MWIPDYVFVGYLAAQCIDVSAPCALSKKKKKKRMCIENASVTFREHVVAYPLGLIRGNLTILRKPEDLRYLGLASRVTEDPVVINFFIKESNWEEKRKLGYIHKAPKAGKPRGCAVRCFDLIGLRVPHHQSSKLCQTN